MKDVWILLPLMGMLIPLIIVPVALGMKHARHERELEHAERMKALELGRSLPQDEPWWTPARVCLAIAVAVPLGSLFCAWMATASAGYHTDVWMVTMVVGLGGVIAGSSVYGRHLASQHELRPSLAKDPIDVDAYDIAGSRG
jgi:hypothetical protein